MRALTTQIFILISISGVLAGCASSKDAVLPANGPSMKAIYDAHFEDMNAASTDGARAAVSSHPPSTDERTLVSYTRNSQTELDTRFPRLPNPTLVMYVFPHLAGPSRVPVPGYSTTFPMYERDEYALPGEVPVPAMRTVPAVEPPP